MKEIEVKKCPKCKRILLEFKETSNNGKGKWVRKKCWSCEKCGKTYRDERDVISIIAKKISPAELLEEKIRKEMFDLKISDDKTTDKARQIADEARLEKLDRWF